MINPHFESIIPTALHTAYPLIYTDIPYSKEMVDELEKLGLPNDLKNPTLAMELEARYKLIDNLLAKSNIKQILELACGYTTRGLCLCEKDKDIKYCELDLPKIIKTKSELFNHFTKIPDNLKLLAGNALNYKDISQIYKFFDSTQPIAIINQGLMRYLNFEEKRKLAQNVYKIISKNNGIWITCDVTPANWIKNQDKIMTNYNQNLTQITNRNNPNWRFKDRNHVTEFFEELGFEIEWHDFIEAKSMLSSPKKLNVPQNQINDYLNGAVVVVMRAKNSR